MKAEGQDLVDVEVDGEGVKKEKKKKRKTDGGREDAIDELFAGVDKVKKSKKHKA